jgi:endonuclease YncB( thermonuclease family)
LRAVFALLCCIASGVQAETFTAKVIAVMDGDTVMVLRGKQKIKVRMANIDAPERGQDFGKQSRESLLEMVGKKQVQIETQAVDQYGRIVALVSIDGRSVNQEQVKRGMAWEYSHYHSDKTYLDLQNEAQQAKHGLWAQPDAQLPWQWRKLHPPKPSIQNQECGKKRLCSQMTSCDEARFYLTRCGVKTLDRNEDGKPCEDLCGSKN